MILSIYLNIVDKSLKLMLQLISAIAAKAFSQTSLIFT